MKEQFKSLFMILSPSDEIRAPVTGKCIPLNEVPDEVFSQNILGEGMAFRPETGLLQAPVNGRVTRVLSDGQVIWIEGKQGVTLLLQIGLRPDEAQNLQVQTLVKKGALIKSGDELAHFDIENMAGLGDHGLVIMVATSVPGKRKIVPVAPEFVVGGRDEVLRLGG